LVQFTNEVRVMSSRYQMTIEDDDVVPNKSAVVAPVVAKKEKKQNSKKKGKATLKAVAAASAAPKLAAAAAAAADAKAVGFDSNAGADVTMDGNFELDDDFDADLVGVPGWEGAGRDWRVDAAVGASTANRTNEIIARLAHQSDDEVESAGSDDSDDSDDGSDGEDGEDGDGDASKKTTKKKKKAKAAKSTSKMKGRDVDDSDSDAVDEDEAAAAEARKAEFFTDANAAGAKEIKSFQQMELSRPILRAVTALGFSAPSLVQQRAIPIALLGRDLCACATTGSGKTAAFMLPCMERLLFRSKKVAATRVLVLSPTRELAVQVCDMARNLAQFTDITFGLSVGGMNLRVQEAQLRERPDVVVATPGRLVDHINNSHGFDLTTIEILILDEADRLLEVGFKDELELIISACPRERQTMLFSATMTDEVDDLTSMSLHEPVRLFVNKNSATTSNLTQEFIRIRGARERHREAIVLSMCCRTYKKKCLIFAQAKVTAHRVRILLGLAGLRVGELHGALTQAQRLNSLEAFTKGEIDFLVCTDLAGRGLDIPGTATVINMCMPNTLKQYIHRVGRTARAGLAGRAVTLVGERERKLLREIVKGEGNFKNRVVPQDTIDRYNTKIQKMEPTIKTVLEEEKVESELDYTEMELRKAQNMVKHRDEIVSRAPRTWIMSADDKKEAKVASRDVHEGNTKGLPSKRKGGPGVQVQADRKKAKTHQFVEDPAGAAIVRAVKRGKKAKRMTVFDTERTDKQRSDYKAANPGKKKKKKKPTSVGFGAEAGRGHGDQAPNRGINSGAHKGGNKVKVQPKDKSKIPSKGVKKFKSLQKHKRRK